MTSTIANTTNITVVSVFLLTTHPLTRRRPSGQHSIKAGTPRSLQGILDKPERVFRPFACALQALFRTLQVLFQPVGVLQQPLLNLMDAADLAQRHAPLGNRKP